MSIDKLNEMKTINDFDPLSGKYLRPSFILLLLAIAIFFRVYKIASIPSSLAQDETAIGYNAYSILQTGKDEWGFSYPLYFKSFGDYKLPAYIYTTALFEKLLGLNEYAVRLPSAIAGIIAVVVVFFLVRYLTQNFTLGIISALLLAINPIHLQFSRAAFEVNFALTSALLGVLLFILAVDKKRLILLFLSVLSFSISLYSYNVTRLLSPLIFLGLVFLYWKKVKKFSLYKLFSAGLFLFITLLPFLINFFSSGGIFSATSSLITSTDIIAKDIEMRSYLIDLPPIFLKIFYNKYTYMVFQYLQNLAVIISGDFFFVSGSPHGNQGIGNVGITYLFQLPFFISGIIVYYLKKIRTYRVFYFWLLASFFTLALSKEVPHATRGYFLVLPIVVFSAYGLFYFIYFVNNLRSDFIKYSVFVSIALFMFYNIQFYFVSYYFRFPYVYSKQWQFQNKELSAYLKNIDSSYDKIIINDKTNFIYTALLFYTRHVVK